MASEGDPILALKGQRTTGETVRSKNVLATSVIANVVKSSLGPEGLDKMLVDDVGDVTITNDGATILKLLEVEHPAGKILVDLAQLQDQEIGDGTTSVVLIAAELLKAADQLVKQKIHPTSIINGYRVACKEAVRYMTEHLSFPVEELNDVNLLCAAKTAMSSKLIGDAADFFALLCVKAAELVKRVDAQTGRITCPITKINVLKAHGRSSGESLLVNGYALNCTRASEDKTRTLTEHQKQMESLRIQLDESKSHAVENEGEMMNTVQELRRQLAQEQQYNRAKTNEFRRLHAEFEALQQQHNQLREEFNKYKQKAELVIRNSNAVAPADPSATAADENDKGSSKHAEKHSTPSTETATPIISIKQANTEIQELIHTIQTRNATNSQLTSKCSMLEDELQRTMEYTRRLRSEIDSLNESLTAAQRMAFQERQRLCQDYEQRLKREELAQNEFRQDLRATAERERAEAENRLQTISTKNESLLHENEKLKAMLNNKNQTPNASQQEQLTRFDTDSAEESVSRKQQQFDNKSVQKKKSITIANDSLALAGGRKHPPPLNFEMTMLSNQPHPMNTSTTTDLDVPSNSESSETYSSNEDLRSILNNLDRPELVSTPTNSAAKMPIGGQSSFGDSTEPPGLFSELSPESFEELNRQLADCNELLRDTEEENARLCEQVRVLKEEIRRLERNRERVEHIDGRNPERTEYFKNVVLKFLAPQNVTSSGVGGAGNAEPTDVRVHLLPVLQTMLQLSAEEMELIRESCDLPAVQSPTTATASNKNDANWKGFFGW